MQDIAKYHKILQNITKYHNILDNIAMQCDGVGADKTVV